MTEEVDKGWSLAELTCYRREGRDCRVYVVRLYKPTIPSLRRLVAVEELARLIEGAEENDFASFSLTLVSMGP